MERNPNTETRPVQDAGNNQETWLVLRKHANSEREHIFNIVLMIQKNTLINPISGSLYSSQACSIGANFKHLLLERPEMISQQHKMNESI